MLKGEREKASRIDLTSSWMDIESEVCKVYLVMCFENDKPVLSLVGLRRLQKILRKK